MLLISLMFSLSCFSSRAFSARAEAGSKTTYANTHTSVMTMAKSLLKIFVFILLFFLSYISQGEYECTYAARHINEHQRNNPAELLLYYITRIFTQNIGCALEYICLCIYTIIFMESVKLKRAPMKHISYTETRKGILNVLFGMNANTG